MKKVVWITGSNRGIGKATALAFAKEGYHIVLHYHTHKEEAIEVQEQILSQYPVEVKIVQGDVAKEEDVKRMVKEVLEKFKTIDVLVNNAGIAIDTLFEDKTTENFQRTLNVNLIGTFLMSKIVGEKMLAQKQGVILNISSTNGMDTFYPMSLDYDASKAGVISLTHNLALQYAPWIRVNAIAPGWVNTPMNQELDAEFKKEEEAKIMLQRFAKPEEIAKVITFLASENASYINSSVIRVDGGKI